jgi:hypothetical protein
VGDAACSSCHQEKTATFLATSHHLTSSPADEHSIAGNFNSGSNILRTSNPSLHFVMSKKDDGFFQTAVDEIDPSQAISVEQRFDIVIGSGRKAQTYLYWKGDELFELPVSYWVETVQWINSPGYADGALRFDRPIVPRCLECHGSRFESLAPPANRFNKDSLVFGITCEKCHGPGSEHVAHHQSEPVGTPSEAIINPGRLPRERQLDACALCHAGAATSLVPPGSFVPGDVLAKFLKIPDPGHDVPVDVHGNQMQLLRQSRCFQSSAMTCTTCHDVHTRQRDAASFSFHCLSCHKAADCGEFHKLGQQIASNCVDCHMPLQDSELLFSDTNGQKIKPKVRNHRIAIYANPATR